MITEEVKQNAEQYGVYVKSVRLEYYYFCNHDFYGMVERLVAVEYAIVRFSGLDEG